MKQNDFYEVNGCNWFIPVDLIEEDKCTKELEVAIRESGRIISVPSIYKFPKPQEPQKPVVPKFVAEWIEEMKQDDRPLYSVMSSLMNKTNHEWTVWKSSNMNFSEIVAKAYLYGYEIEPERLYTVEIPNPNLNAHVVLQKTEKGLVLVTVGNAGWAEWESSKVTEAGIKKDFDFLWQFKKEVE